MDKKNPEWINNEQVIQHMNSNHCNSIVSALNAQYGIKDPEAKNEEFRSQRILNFIL